MTRYESLSLASDNYALLHFQAKRACEKCAVATKQAIGKYLEAPAGSLRFVVLDVNQESTGELSPAPHLVSGTDGKWKFVLQLRLQASGSAAFGLVGLHFAVQDQPDGFVLTHDGTYRIPAALDSGFEPLCESIYKRQTEDLTRPRGEHRPKIGFYET